jgi:DNA processing protein
MTEKYYQIALSQVEGIGDVLLRNLISYCGSAEEVFKASSQKLLKVPGIGEVLLSKLQERDVLNKADEILKYSEKSGIQIIAYTDAGYPSRLKNLYDAPAILYYQGSASLQHKRTLGIVGTRQATDYGKRICNEIVEGLKSYNVLIVSGLAYGIDIAAHKACLQASMPTIGVMANGLDRVYPTVHEKVAQQMVENGGVMSESPFGTGPDAPRFVARNRIIAGLSDVSIVVESAKKGGSLITAEYANNYHREVFAVPGDLTRKYSEGCNALLKDNKAQIYTSINDVIEALNWDMAEENSSSKIKQQLAFDFASFSTDEAQVISLLKQHGAMHLDDLAWQSQIYVNRLASTLLNLEFQGIVKSLPGKKYELMYV